MKLKIEVIDIDENPNFENGQFDVPTNVTFTEVNMPAAIIMTLSNRLGMGEFVLWFQI
ncbi:MAG: hypothetical protein IPH42_18935 [Bacteroidetes bacterium]|nr:hypothetical protein [Bacteroidota bacterium]